MAYHRTVPPDETTEKSTPLDRERALVDLLWSASAERADSERQAVARGARGRSLNERMHRSALDTLEVSLAAQLAAVEAEYARRTEEIETAAHEASRKVKLDEKTVRAKATRQAEQHEEDARRAERVERVDGEHWGGGGGRGAGRVRGGARRAQRRARARARATHSWSPRCPNSAGGCPSC